LWREPPGLRKFAGKGLEADDERQLHDLCLCEMLPHLVASVGASRKEAPGQMLAGALMAS